MDNPSRNQTEQTQAVKISLRWPRLRCWGNKSTTPVTTPSIPTNLRRKKDKNYKQGIKETVPAYYSLFAMYHISQNIWSQFQLSAETKIKDNFFFNWELKFLKFIGYRERGWVKFNSLLTFRFRLRCTDRGCESHWAQNSLFCLVQAAQSLVPTEGITDLFSAKRLCR